MTWTYWNWVICSILIGVGIFLFVFVFLTLLLWNFHKQFYGLVAKLFNIKRCTIDRNKSIVQENSRLHTDADTKSCSHFLSKLFHGIVAASALGQDIASSVDEQVEQEQGIDDAASDKNQSMSPNPDDYEPELPQSEHVDDFQNEFRCCWPKKVGTIESNSPVAPPKPIVLPAPTTKQGDLGNPSLDHTQILDMYGRHLSLHKKRTKFLIITLTTIVISSVILAAFETCFLADTTVYQGGPCPPYGIMDCYHGPNTTYFQCNPGDTINFQLLASSATCFRWIGRDISISDVMNQIGICTGLLTALGAIVEVFLKLLIFAFEEHRGVSCWIHRVMQNKFGKKFHRIYFCRCCCGLITQQCRFGPFDLRLYKHPWLVVLVFLVYLLLPIFLVAAIVLLSLFRISITSLTYSIIGTLVLICCLALFWVLLEEPAIGSGEPMTLDHIMSKEQLENIIELGRTAFPELKTEDAKSEDKKEAVKRDGIRTERETSKGDLTSKRQLTGAAKKIRERKEEENSKNVKRKIHLRKNSSDDDDEDNA